MPRKKNSLCNYNCEVCKLAWCIAPKRKVYEHFSRIVYESHRKIFYVTTRGEAYSVDKFSNKRTELKNCMHDGQVRVSIHGLKSPELKRLVWMVAKSRYPARDEVVVCIDGDETNCSIENLKIISKAERARATGPMSRSKPVIVETRNNLEEYRSVREAAKAIWVSYQTLLDYLNGVSKTSVIKKRGRHVYYKNKEDRVHGKRGKKNPYRDSQKPLRTRMDQ